MTLRIGTRASALALAQSGQVGRALAGQDVELVHVRTHGDADRSTPLAQLGGTGVFVTAVRGALLDGDVDVIVHSCKDLPTTPVDGITIAAIPAREDPRDALCARGGRTLAELPDGARVGTGSPRRASQLRRARPDLQVVGIRGNVGTRLARALGENADLDAVVLAAAGLQRLGRDEVISELLPTDVLVPAPAQGALAVECRTADAEGSDLAGALAAVDDLATRTAVTAERALLRALEAGCSAPVGAYGRREGDQVVLDAVAISYDGTRAVEGRTQVALPEPADAAVAAAQALGEALAKDMLGRGAGQIITAAAQELG
ncbi:MAG: hydroxymethylbilane synthase [Brachybacterium sp.]|nr:hydroxymethylbilane synthase [Brachybacterium sp.]